MPSASQGTAYCAVCGHSIDKTPLRGAEIRGHYIDYIHRHTGSFNTSICISCWETFDELSDIESCHCSTCGRALEWSQVAAETHGRYVDYVRRQRGEISTTLCHVCWERICAIEKDGPTTAARLEDEISRIDLEDQERMRNPCPQ